MFVKKIMYMVHIKSNLIAKKSTLGDIDTANSPVCLQISWVCYFLYATSCFIEKCILKESMSSC